MDTKSHHSTTKIIEYSLLEPVDSVENFLKNQFHSSGNKLKKYFSKAFLNQSLKARQTLMLPLNFVNDGHISPDYIGVDLKILYEDENFFVFEKRANQHTHPLSYDEGDNCLSWLRKMHGDLLKVNRAHYDRGLLFRLDFETSGLLIYAKSDAIYEELREGFGELVKEKVYLSWLHGEFKDRADLRHSFSSSEAKGKRVMVADLGVHEKVGELSLEALSFDPKLNSTLARVRLKTGLRHQIRAQLAHIGYPLVGDVFYGGNPAQRLYLHAFQYSLSFKGRNYFFEANPIDFKGL